MNHADPVPLTVQTSDWGPVVETELGPMAMHWVIQLPGAIDLSLMSLAHARSVEAALVVGQQAGIPAQNLLVADNQGHIGWTLAGTLPDRLTPGEQNACRYSPHRHAGVRPHYRHNSTRNLSTRHKG